MILSDLNPRKMLVERVDDEAAGVRTFRLADPDGGELPPWTPGAHVALRLANGLVRQYSLCGDVDDRQGYRISVLREPDSRGGSQFLHEGVAAGDLVEVVSLRNQFELVDAEAYLFVAGGIGVTPIVPMVAEAARRGVPWRLAYGGRSRASMAFVAELEAFGDRGTVGFFPQDEVGLLDLDELVATRAPGSAVYCCGPEPLLTALEGVCAAAGCLDVLHLERFAASGDAVVAAGGDADTEFEVELARSGVVRTVPADRTLLSVVQEHVPDILLSCEEGYCGTCETRVLDGVPDHRDEVLSEAERETGELMMICVGRSRTPRLVLDL